MMLNSFITLQIVHAYTSAAYAQELFGAVKGIRNREERAKAAASMLEVRMIGMCHVGKWD